SFLMQRRLLLQHLPFKKKYPVLNMLPEYFPDGVSTFYSLTKTNTFTKAGYTALIAVSLVCSLFLLLREMQRTLLRRLTQLSLHKLQQKNILVQMIQWAKCYI